MASGDDLSCGVCTKIDNNCVLQCGDGNDIVFGDCAQDPDCSDIRGILNFFLAMVILCSIVCFCCCCAYCFFTASNIKAQENQRMETQAMTLQNSPL